MAENPHDLEKELKGLGLSDLTSNSEGSIIDKISQLKHDYDTGNSQQLHAIEKTIKEYNKTLSTFVGDEAVRVGEHKVDALGAGFLPLTITGFFNIETNEKLFRFFSSDNNAYVYSFRKLNPDYTGYSCRVRRMYDMAMVDVRFDDDGIVSPNSSVDLAFTGFGTGLRGDERTLSGFCKPHYLGTGMTKTEYNTATIAKIYSQGKNRHFTGEFHHDNYTAGFGTKPETTMASGESFGLDVNDVNNASYGDFAATSDFDGQFDDWQLLKGTGVNFDGKVIQFPIYVKSRQFQQLQVMYPHSFGSTFPYGLRWVVRDRQTLAGMTNWSNVVSYFINNSSAGFTDGQAYSNELITVGSFGDARLRHGNRPYDFTSWSVKDGTLGNGFDSSSTFVYHKNLLNTQPIIATGARKMFYDEGTSRLGMKFNQEGNASVLHNDGNFISFGSQASMGAVVSTNETGANQTVMSQGSQLNPGIEGPGPSHDGAFLAYGLHFHLSQYAWKARFFDTSTILKTDSTVQDSGRNTGKHFIIMSANEGAANATGGSKGILEFDGVRKVAVGVNDPHDTQPFQAVNTRIGARLASDGTLKEPFDGTLYEFFFFGNDAQLDEDETNRFVPNVTNYHNINLQG